MKRLFEFPLFYLLWVISCLELMLALSKDYMQYIALGGILLLGVTLAFMWCGSGCNEVIYLLLQPLLGMLVAAIVISTLVSRSPIMLCVIGMEVLLLFNMERGYKYEHTYEP